MLEEEIAEYQKALDVIWKYITKLLSFGKECKCEELDTDDTFDTIDYTSDAPTVNRWCLICGGYRYL